MQRKIIKHGATTILAALAMGAAGSSAWAGGALDIDFDADNFDGSMSWITNLHWPLTPSSGAQTFTYVGGNDDECVVNKIYVDSEEIKDDFVGDYEDIIAQVVLDQEWLVELEEGEECNVFTPVGPENLTERTFDWYAQDVFWNVWYMGEHSRSFEDGCPGPEVADEDVEDEECFEGSWEAGQYGPEMEIIAAPGIVVPSDYPSGGELIEPGTYYMQEVAEGAEDMAKILKVNSPLSVEDGVEPGDYDNCRKVKEWNPSEHGQSVEHKWYCLGGNGLVLIQGIGGGPTENEVLVEITSD